MLNGLTIETQDLILRPFKISDADSVFKNWASDKRVQKMYSEPTYNTVEEVKELLNKYIANYKSTDKCYRWAVILKESKECIGQIAYFMYDQKNNFAEIEYCIGAQYQNKGYATVATKAVINFGFETMRLHKVQICTKEINKKSQRVIEKCGFTYEGTLRDYFYMDGAYTGRMYFSILESEYSRP